MKVRKWVEEIPEEIIPAKVIPAQKIPRCAYIAFDGKEFYDEASCKRYETMLGNEKIVDNLPHLECILIDGLDIDEVVYIKSWLEFNSVTQHLNLFRGYDISTLQWWKFDGEDWYIFYSDYNDDLMEYYYYMETFTELEKRYTKELNQFKKEGIYESNKGL